MPGTTRKPGRWARRTDDSRPRAAVQAKRWATRPCAAANRDARACRAGPLPRVGIGVKPWAPVGSTTQSIPPVAWGAPELKALRARIQTAGRWDLAIVGAGITGAGIARDAARRGLSVLVLEARDVAFGTSSRSTRLVHGGVRYLEQGEIGLVYEALRERSRLRAAAPHLVTPARFLFPTYQGDRLGPWRLRLGLTLYDALDFHRGEPHTYLSPEACLAAEPLLSPSGLRGAVEYEDAITDDARLTLTVLQDAVRNGADVLTYAEVEAIGSDPEGHVLHLADGTQVRARQAVVATGPWTGRRLLGAVGEGLLTLSKGIHVVMRRRDLPVHQPLVLQAPRQRRILFAIPWGTRTYLGTTDTPYTGDPAESGVTENDELELLDVVRRAITGAPLDPANIVSAWAGVRPLVRDPRRGSETVEMSRRHRIVSNEDGVLGIVGGKLTTFRSMAEEMVDLVVRRIRDRLPPERASLRRCDTHLEPLYPGPPLEPDGLRDPLAADLYPRHGPRTRDLVASVRRDPASGERLVDDLPYRWCEIDEAIAAEGVTHLSDILRRRLPLALTDPDLGGSIARRVAERLVRAWGGSSADVEVELERYAEEVRLETRRTPRLS